VTAVVPDDATETAPGDRWHPYHTVGYTDFPVIRRSVRRIPELTDNRPYHRPSSASTQHHPAVRTPVREGGTVRRWPTRLRFTPRRNAPAHHCIPPDPFVPGSARLCHPLPLATTSYRFFTTDRLSVSHTPVHICRPS